jgi:tRNA-dihydrouridine synthase A
MRKVCIAPMLDWTDRHERFFLRLISQKVFLYSEMVTTGAILHGNRNKVLDFNSEENPIALQLGGSDPQALATCAKIGETWGYDEINLNVGCPSDRVQFGKFGACLMAEPNLVADCISNMQENVKIPVTIKHRLGIDDLDSYELLFNFVETVSKTGCNIFIVHARKAFLKGLNPKENRDIPPLIYDRVYQLKQELPHLEIIINGGIKTLNDIKEHLKQVDGVMVGRAAYENPYILANIDQEIFGETYPIKTRCEILKEFLPYIEEQQRQGVHLKHISRHLLGLFQGQIGARMWRRYLSEHAHLENASIKTIIEAAKYVGCEL